VDARERASGFTPGAAEGATAPESLRQKDRADRTLWKADHAFGHGPTEGVSRSRLRAR
jgi:hypothetical protein